MFVVWSVEYVTLVAPEWKLINDSSDFAVFASCLCREHPDYPSKHVPFIDLVWEMRVILPIFVFESVDLALASKLLPL